jgi:hypothetical protein
MGTWNSDVAMIYLVIFASPFLLLILKEIIAVTSRIKIVERVEYITTPPTTVYKTKVETKVVYKNKPSKKPLASNFSKPKPKTKPVNKPRKQNKASPAIKPSLSPVQRDTISALRGIGLTKADAKEIVESKYSSLKHKNFESLFKDCMNVK